MPRYANKKKIKNNKDIYEFLKEKRNHMKIIEHYDTIILKNPSILDRANLKTANHVWKYGDRYYKLAERYYKAPEYWWVIAWYNARPTEADVSNGDVISIPLNLEQALIALRSY